MDIITAEYAKMKTWLYSTQFSDICFVLELHEDNTRHRLLATCHNPVVAREIARIYKLHIHNLTDYQENG